jgi:hypothetical protein
MTVDVPVGDDIDGVRGVPVYDDDRRRLADGRRRAGVVIAVRIDAVATAQRCDAERCGGAEHEPSDQSA